MKKLVACLSLCFFLATTAYGAKLSLKFNGGGTYLIGGDYNKGVEGWGNYEKSVLFPGEILKNNMKKLGLGFEFGGELIYELNPSLAVGIEGGYLSASVESWFSRDWHNYKLTLKPVLSVVPLTFNIHYFMPLGASLKLQVEAGAGACFSSLNYKYDIQDSVSPYNGTWKPKSKIVFGAKAGVGLELTLTANVALTFDVLGRLAEVKGFTGGWSGVYNGVSQSGDGTLYYYEVFGTYSWIGLWGTAPSGSDYQNVREAKFSLSGVSALIGFRVNL